MLTMPICKAPNCGNTHRTKDPGLSWHRFPLNKPDLLKRWLHHMGHPDFTVTPASRLCSKHFTHDCFEESMYHRIMGLPPPPVKKRLKADAVPLLFDRSPAPQPKQQMHAGKQIRKRKRKETTESWDQSSENGGDLAEMSSVHEVHADVCLSEEENGQEQRGTKMMFKCSEVSKSPTIACPHNAEDSQNFCCANLLTSKDLELNHSEFNRSSSKAQQDKALSVLLEFSSIDGVQVKDRIKKPHVIIKYHLFRENDTQLIEKIPVCKSTFMSVFGISEERVSRVAKYYVENATPTPEKSGRTKKQKEGMNTLRKFIHPPHSIPTEQQSDSDVMNIHKKKNTQKSPKRLTDFEDAEATSDPDFSSLLHPVKLKECVEHWLNEDTSSFDYGGYVVKDKQETAFLFCKSEGVLAGCPFFNAVFHTLGCEVEWDYPEGTDFCQDNGFAELPVKVATVTGSARKLLLGERVALNCITRACGIATVARHLAGKKHTANWHGEIAGTRKTTPGFRMVEKYALLVGGVSTHRYDLSSMVMLKDNHIWSAESIEEAVKMARKACGFSLKIEVECQNLSEAMAAAAAGCDIVMLDNMMPKDLHSAAEAFKVQFPNCLVEASGGVTPDNIEDYMGPNVDVISLGALTQGYPCMDLSLKVQQDIRT